MSHSPAAKRQKVSNEVKQATFPIKAFPGEYKRLSIDPFAVTEPTKQQLADLQFNIDLCRDAMVAFSATGSASGYGGHTGGAFDTVPEVVILDAFFRARCPTPPPGELLITPSDPGRKRRRRSSSSTTSVNLSSITRMEEEEVSALRDEVDVVRRELRLMGETLVVAMSACVATRCPGSTGEP